MVLIGLAIILIFAAIGVVSAGAFVGNKLAGGSAQPTATAGQPTTVPSSLQDVRRARAQATRIVAQARRSGKNAASRALTRAHAQATSVVAAARKKASSAPAPVAPASPPVAPAPTSAFPSTGSARSATSPGNGSISSGASPGAPNLSGVPASWKVVAYNATFGTGSGVGTVTVLNRSSGSFSGTVKIAYAKGGAAYASFSGLAPGQSEVLALSGSPYPGGGYTILLPSVH
jgi:hypothetical protein